MKKKFIVLLVSFRSLYKIWKRGCFLNFTIYLFYLTSLNLNRARSLDEWVETGKRRVRVFELFFPLCFISFLIYYIRVYIFSYLHFSLYLSLSLFLSFHLLFLFLSLSIYLYILKLNHTCTQRTHESSIFALPSPVPPTSTFTLENWLFQPPRIQSTQNLNEKRLIYTRFFPGNNSKANLDDH